MKIYLIQFNECGYDEYDSFVVAAENKDQVVKLVQADHPEEKYGAVDWKGGYKITELKLDKPEIILGSFNAG